MTATGGMHQRVLETALSSRTAEARRGRWWAAGAFAVLALLAVTVPVSPAWAEETVVNGDLEDDVDDNGVPDGWTTENDAYLNSRSRTGSLAVSMSHLNTSAPSTLSQEVLIGNTGGATLEYWYSFDADPVTTLNVTLDGQVVDQLVNDGRDLDYVFRSVDVSDFADGQPHLLRFEHVKPADSSGYTTLLLDDISLVAAATVESSVSLAYKPGRTLFKGQVVADHGCQADRVITVKKVKDGRDRVVGTDQTNLQGVFKVNKAVGPGRYYAVAADRDDDVARCLAGRSQTVRLR